MYNETLEEADYQQSATFYSVGMALSDNLLSELHQLASQQLPVVGSGNNIDYFNLSGHAVVVDPILQKCIQLLL